MSAPELNATTFRETIQSSEPVLVDFHAEWCPPCKALGPTIDALAADHAGRVGKLNVDDEREIAREYGIKNIPTILVFKDGEPIERFVGLTAREDLERALNSERLAS
ncbi:MAG: thioredoxin [Phycisphaerales bacterium]|nr:thioredoxin [Phycisphaerales bacterium]